jgi:O-antigen ligase
MLLFLGLNSPQAAMAMALAAFTVLIVWAAWRVQSDTAMLLCALVTIELYCSASVLPVSEEQRFMIRYPLLLLFCLPAAIRSIRNPLLRRAGFRDYLLYLGWGAVSISYSLLPGYSFGRLLAAVLLLIVSIKLVAEMKDAHDLQRPLRWFLVGLALMWAGNIAALVAAPHDVAWSQDVPGMDRFRGFFGSPNQIGEAMLATVSAALITWNSASRRQKALIGIEVAVAVAFGALADSRSPFVGLGLGGLLYLFWRYRLRALPICLLGAAAVFAIATQVDTHYFTRGDVSTLTGRTEVWKFAIQKIKERPLTGWGFEVEGQVMQSKYFPIWWGPWDEGPRSSFHSGYLSRAIGVGVPAFAFWVFFFLRPWFWIFRRSEDPWGLKRIFLLVIVPILVLNSVETTAGDCRYSVGLLATICWGLAERYRIEQLDAQRQEVRLSGVLPVGFHTSASATE